MAAPRILYVHVPKCGGTSFGSALRAASFPSQATIDLGRSGAIRRALFPDADETDRVLREWEVKQVMLGDLLARRVRCISAHACYSERLHTALDPERRVVTMLRDPVERFVSHFHYVHRRHADAGRPSDLTAFLETEDALRYGSTYLFYFAETYQHVAADLPAAIARAKSNLSRFALIGDLSRSDAFRRSLQSLARRPVVSWSRNRRPAAARAPLTDTLRAQIAAICAPDLEIYAYAKTLPTFV